MKSLYSIRDACKTHLLLEKDLKNITFTSTKNEKNHLTQFSKNILPTLIAVIIKLIMPIKMCLSKSRK